jgi:hypothetical protein
LVFICLSLALSSSLSLSLSVSLSLSLLLVLVHCCSPAFQTVVNALTTRVVPQHDAVFASIADLGSQYQRFVPWLPYPRLGIAALEPPSGEQLCGFVNSGGPAGAFDATLSCGQYGTIASVVFASYGTPSGFCGSLVQNSSCHAPQSEAVVSSLCVGQNTCTVLSNDDTFGGAPCVGDTRLAVQVTCSAAAGANFTSWDFEWPDQSMVDFMVASGDGERSAIPNFSTPPQWLFTGPRQLYPDDPLQTFWSYENGGPNNLVDPTGQQFGEYYGRLVAYYVEGGFTDEGGRFIKGHQFNITHWEVLNEVEAEHQFVRRYHAITVIVDQ